MWDNLKYIASHAVIYVGLSLLIGFMLYSSFLKPTSSQKTIVQDGGTKIDYWQGSTIAPHFGGCVSLQAEKYLKDKK